MGNVEPEILDVLGEIIGIEEGVGSSELAGFLKLFQYRAGLLEVSAGVETGFLQIVTQTIVHQILHDIQTATFQHLEKESQSNLLMIRAMAAVLDDDIKLNIVDRIGEGLKLLGISLVEYKGLDAVVIQMGSGIDVGSVNGRVRKVIVPRLQGRSALRITAMSNASRPVFPMNTQANFQKVDGGETQFLEVRLVNVRVIMRAPLVARALRALVGSVFIGELCQ